MSIEKVKEYFRQYGMEDRVWEKEHSSATVEEAAEALGCEPQRIAKTLSFQAGDRVVLVVTAGDRKIDNKKYREQFGCKAKMLKFEEVEDLVGHAVGGVCPFAVKEGVEVYLDESLKQFGTVYPAAGNDHSAVKLTIPELEQIAGAKGWVDVCKEQ